MHQTINDEHGHKRQITCDSGTTEIEQQQTNTLLLSEQQVKVGSSKFSWIKKTERKKKRKNLRKMPKLNSGEEFGWTKLTSLGVGSNTQLKFTRIYSPHGLSICKNSTNQKEDNELGDLQKLWNDEVRTSERR